MQKLELLSTEKDFFDKLSSDEQVLYMADNEQLAILEASNDYTVRSFIDVSRQMNELDRLHRRYNDYLEFGYKLPNDTEEHRARFNRLYQVNDELFSMTLSIGTFATVFSLSCMDECDALYHYLATVKMNRFNYLADSVDIAQLVSQLTTD